MNKEIKDSINYRLNKINEYNKSTGFSIENNYFSTIPYSLYFACFNSVRVLMLTKNIDPKTHSGLKIEFFRLFVKTGKIDKELGCFYSIIYTFYQENEYGEVDKYELNDVKFYFERTKEFVKKIKTFVEEELKNNN